MFERVRMVKELLYKTHSSKDGFLVARFATSLGQISQRAAHERASFFDVLFAQVRT